jgi:zinc transporter ZupT
MLILQACIVVVFVLEHILAGRLRFLDRIPRSRVLSLAGGISVAYVFVHIFPELAVAQERIHDASRLQLALDHHAYLICMFGLGVFYGLDRLIQRESSGDESSDESTEGESPVQRHIFWLHILSFAVYNALIGYLLVHREDQTAWGLVFFSFAMVLHFLANDYGLRKDHKDTYDRAGRWVLGAAVALGWALGHATQMHKATVAVLFAFIAGGIILNVLKEELPEDRKSRFLPFALGAAGYTTLLLTI